MASRFRGAVFLLLKFILFAAFAHRAEGRSFTCPDGQYFHLKICAEKSGGSNAAARYFAETAKSIS
jgi:hypothetical protein